MQNAQELKRRDLTFWSDAQNLHNIDNNVNKSNINFYGEVIACLAFKLKKCVMFSSIYDDKVMQRYKDTVLCDLFSTVQHLQFQPITNSVESANDSEYKGLYVLYIDDPNDKLICDMKRLFFEPMDPPATVMLSELFFARLFDYPTALPEHDEMNKLMHGQLNYSICEVAYKDMSDAQNPIVITTFGIRNTTKDLEAVKRHFTRFKSSFAQLFPISLEIVEL